MKISKTDMVGLNGKPRLMSWLEKEASKMKNAMANPTYSNAFFLLHATKSYGNVVPSHIL